MGIKIFHGWELKSSISEFLFYLVMIRGQNVINIGT